MPSTCIRSRLPRPADRVTPQSTVLPVAPPTPLPPQHFSTSPYRHHRIARCKNRSRIRLTPTRTPQLTRRRSTSTSRTKPPPHFPAFLSSTTATNSSTRKIPGSLSRMHRIRMPSTTRTSNLSRLHLRKPLAASCSAPSHLCRSSCLPLICSELSFLYLEIPSLFYRCAIYAVVEEQRPRAHARERSRSGAEKRNESTFSSYSPLFASEARRPCEFGENGTSSFIAFCTEEQNGSALQELLRSKCEWWVGGMRDRATRGESGRIGLSVRRARHV